MKNNKFFTVVVLLGVLTGCATTGTNPIDPWENWNRDVQSFNDELDKHVLKPVAEGYDWVMPDFAHKAVTNFFSNINDIAVVVNDMLQGKFLQTGEDSARFLMNSTLGLGGLIDWATDMDLPKHNEDFDQTLGVWGVPTGPYIVLPIFGPSSPRGVAGLVTNAAMNPINYFTGPFISFGLSALNLVDTRADNLSLGEIANEAALDRYVFFRDAYLEKRRSLVLDGKVVPEENGFDIDKALDETLKEEKK